jgi:hypothetical protein
MPSITIYLGAVGDAAIADEARAAIQATLLGWYTRVTAGTHYTASVSWVTSEPAGIQNNDLLCYFVRGRADSVLDHLPGRRDNGNGVNGTTAWASNHTASEVYVANSRDVLAELAFHELMHNKLHVGDSLHTGNGLAVEAVSAGMTPSEQNITQLRGALGASHPQWTGGWLAAADPLSGL